MSSVVRRCFVGGVGRVVVACRRRRRIGERGRRVVGVEIGGGRYERAVDAARLVGHDEPLAEASVALSDERPLDQVVQRLEEHRAALVRQSAVGARRQLQ